MNTVKIKTLEVTRYYTDLSLILFAIALILPHSLLKTALLLNSVFVGLMGNLIMIRNVDEWTTNGRWTIREVMLGNFFGHTLPMFLSFIALLGCPPKDGDANKILLLLTGLFMLWASIPYRGKSLGEKVYDSYSIGIGVLVVGTTLLTLSTCHAMKNDGE
jgi:hypothetical protein